MRGVTINFETVDNREDSPSIYCLEGDLPGGRPARIELWQQGALYHVTIFTPWIEHEHPAVLFESLIHAGVVEFVGERYVRFERVDDPSRWPYPVWSLNAAVGNAEHPCISRLPLPWNVDSYSVWDDDGEEQLMLLPPLIAKPESPG